MWKDVRRLSEGGGFYNVRIFVRDESIAGIEKRNSTESIRWHSVHSKFNSTSIRFCILWQRENDTFEVRLITRSCVPRHATFHTFVAFYGFLCHAIFHFYLISVAKSRTSAKFEDWNRGHHVGRWILPSRHTNFVAFARSFLWEKKKKKKERKESKFRKRWNRVPSCFEQQENLENQMIASPLHVGELPTLFHTKDKWNEERMDELRVVKFNFASKQAMRFSMKSVK